MNRNSFIKRALSGALAFFGVKSAQAESVQSKWIWGTEVGQTGIIHHFGSITGGCSFSEADMACMDVLHFCSFQYNSQIAHVDITLHEKDEIPQRHIRFESEEVGQKSPMEVRKFLEQMYQRYSSV